MIHSAADLQRAIDRFGHFITCAHDLGLKINFQKTVILLRLAGTFHTHAQSKHIQRTADGVFLCIPYGHGHVARIPLKAQVTYLGVCITYGNLQRTTLDHRIEAARHLFRRLRIWLSPRSQLPLQHRYQLWKSTVFAAMNYGIYTVGLKPQGLQLIQTEIMRQLRHIAGNFPQITALTHAAFLHQHNWPAPAQLLLNRVEGMICRNHTRFLDLAPTDIVLQHDWTHLDDIAALLRQAMAAEPTASALATVLHPTDFHRCFFCEHTFATVRARKMHMWMAHGYMLKHFRPVDLAHDSYGTMPYCKYCGVEFSTWTLFHKHMALHVDHDVAQVTATELARQLHSMPPDPVPPASVPVAVTQQASPQSEPLPLPASNRRSSVPAQFQQSALFDKARSTEVGARALNLIHAHDWSSIKTDDDVKGWLSSHCVVCNIAVGGLKKMNMHMRQNHQSLIDGLYQTAGTVLKRCGTASPCEFCQKEFQVEHLCPAIIQASMVLIHELPLADGPAEQLANAAVDAKRTRRLIVHNFVLARDSMEGNPQCRHCRRKFDTLNGLKLHISLGKCHQFDINRSCTPVPPNEELLQHVRDGTLMLWMADAHLRMRWTCHCQTCGIRYVGAAGLANHMQQAHSALWHAATTCTSFLSAYVMTVHRCVCNPSPGHMRTEHQCLILRQVAMQYIRARDAGQFPGLFVPYRLEACELQAVLPFAPAEFCNLLIDVIRQQHMAPLWTSLFIQLLSRKCLICGYEANQTQLSDHLTTEHSLALNSAMLLNANLAALVLGYFQSSASQPSCPLCAASCAETTLQQHLVLCPVLHQLAWALSLPCHRHGRANGVPSAGPVGGSVPAHGSSAGQAGAEDLGSNDGPQGCSATQTSQRPHQWKRQEQRPGQGESKRRRSGLGNSSANSGKVGHALGPPTQTAKPLLLPDLFHQQSRGKYSQGSDRDHISVEDDGGTRDGNKEPEECAVGNSDDLHASEGAASCGGFRLRGDGAACPESRPAVGRPLLAIPGMECPQATNDSDFKDAQENGRNDEVLAGSCGEQQGRPIGPELSHHEALAQGGAAFFSSGCSSVPMAPGSQSPGRRYLDFDDAAPRECSLEPLGLEIQASVNAPERPDSAAGAPIEGSEMITFLQQGDMQLLMMQLKLKNAGNYCYCNAVMYCLWWTLLSRQAYCPGDWGASQAAMQTFFSRCVDTLMSVPNSFADLFNLWDHGTGPADAAEFAYYALRWLNAPCFSHQWGRYYAVENVRHQHDIGDLHALLFLQVPHSDISSIGLSDLIARWAEEYGMQTALLDAPDAVVCHIDRTAERPDGTVSKLQFWLHSDSVCELPTMMPNGCQVQTAYVPVALAAHLGDIEGGHYRAALRLSAADGDLALSTQYTIWALTDDHAAPVIYPLPGLPEWICRNTTLVFLVKLSSASLCRPLQTPDSGWFRLRTLRQAAACLPAADSALPSNDLDRTSCSGGPDSAASSSRTLPPATALHQAKSVALPPPPGKPRIPGIAPDVLRVQGRLKAICGMYRIQPNTLNGRAVYKKDRSEAYLLYTTLRDWMFSGRPDAGGQRCEGWAYVTDSAEFPDQVCSVWKVSGSKGWEEDPSLVVSCYEGLPAEFKARHFGHFGYPVLSWIDWYYGKYSEVVTEKVCYDDGLLCIPVNKPEVPDHPHPVTVAPLVQCCWG
eukprot:s128_g27.t1